MKSIILAAAILAQCPGGQCPTQPAWQVQVQQQRRQASVKVSEAWQQFPIVATVPASRSYRGVRDDVLAHGGTDSSTHEGVHFINSDLRMTAGGTGRANAVYLLSDAAAFVWEPPIKLSQVANAIPQEKRGEGFSLYLVQAARDWNDCPCYVLDEWSAYIAGCLAYREAGDASNASLSLRRAIEFSWYGHTLADLATQCQGYDARQLVAIVNLLKDRTRALVEPVRVVRENRACDPVRPPAIDPLPPAPPIPEEDKLENRVAKLEAQVAALKLQPGPPGERGPQGERGPAGKDGTNGRDGKDAAPLDIAKLPPIHVQVIRDGKVIESEDVPLGGTLPLRLVPVVSPGR